MLIAFSASNFRSIGKKAHLHLVAGSGGEHRDTHVTTASTGGTGSVDLLRTVAIYGANAAGKSNLLAAIGAMCALVTRPLQDMQSSPVVPFLLDPASAAEPSTFEISCVAGGTRYQYGFEATATEIVAEWLLAWPIGRPQLWFRRRDGQIKFGSKLSGSRDVWWRATRPDALFLTTAIALNNTQMRPLFDWFSKRLRVAPEGTWDTTFSLACVSDHRKERILQFLQAADLAISGMRVVEEEFSPEMLSEDLPAALREELGSVMQGAKQRQLRLLYLVPAGATELELDEESDGVQKLFALAGPWLDALEKGYVAVVDDLHEKLHPKLMRFLVDLFHDPVCNSKGAQLVFSTHDTSILSQDALRRDQIWFCAHNDRRETELFPLTDFQPCKDDENLAQSYLSGRYGAVPCIGKLLASDAAEADAPPVSRRTSAAR